MCIKVKFNIKNARCLQYKISNVAQVLECAEYLKGKWHQKLIAWKIRPKIRPLQNTLSRLHAIWCNAHSSWPNSTVNKFFILGYWKRQLERLIGSLISMTLNTFYFRWKDAFAVLQHLVSVMWLSSISSLWCIFASPARILSISESWKRECYSSFTSWQH